MSLNTPEIDGWPAEIKLFRPLRPFRAIGQAMLSFVTERHTVPYAEAVPERGADNMLLGEERMQEYWQPMIDFGMFDYTGGVATVETPVPHTRFEV